MAYEYEKDILELLKDIEKERSLDLSKEINEIQGTYQTARLIDNIVITTKKRLTEQERKAKAFDEIVIETTGAIMNCPPGAVETEAGRLTLDIIEKYDMEDE